MVSEEWNFSEDPRHEVPRIRRKISFRRNHLSANEEGKFPFYVKIGSLMIVIYFYASYRINFPIDLIENIEINNNDEVKIH